MNKPLTPDQALNRAAALCARCEQAPADIREKLLKWGLNSGETSQVLGRLIEQGYIDERRFARAFVNDRVRFNGWGRIKIAHQLRLKGISSEVIDEAMTLIDEEQYRQRLLELLQVKWRSVSGRESRTAWTAMMRFAASRGFEAGIAGDCVKQVIQLDAQDD